VRRQSSHGSGLFHVQGSFSHCSIFIFSFDRATFSPKNKRKAFNSHSSFNFNCCARIWLPLDVSNAPELTRKIKILLSNNFLSEIFFDVENLKPSRAIFPNSNFIKLRLDQKTDLQIIIFKMICFLCSAKIMFMQM